jgi:hypothetical protein
LKANQHFTSEDDWREWERACAVERCAPPHAYALCQFGLSRFMKCLERYAVQFNASWEMEREQFLTQTEKAWRLLETHAQVKNNRQGKQYKAWLFARADLVPEDWLSMMESGASLLMRDAVRGYLRREYRQHGTHSFYALNGFEPGTVPLPDLIPDHASLGSGGAEYELRDAAQHAVQKLWPSLGRSERIILWARHMGFRFNDPDLQEAVGVGKSRLHTLYKEMLERICLHVSELFAEDAAEFRLQLAQRIIELLGEKIFSHFFAEMAAFRFLMIGEMNKVK